MNNRDFRELVGIAIGEASMCWTATPAGVFDSTRASAIVDRIVAAATSIQEVSPPNGDTAPTAEPNRGADAAAVDGDECSVSRKPVGKRAQDSSSTSKVCQCGGQIALCSFCVQRAKCPHKEWRVLSNAEKSERCTTCGETRASTAQTDSDTTHQQRLLKVAESAKAYWRGPDESPGIPSKEFFIMGAKYGAQLVWAEQALTDTHPSDEGEWTKSMSHFASEKNYWKARAQHYEALYRGKSEQLIRFVNRAETAPTATQDFKTWAERTYGTSLAKIWDASGLRFDGRDLAEAWEAGIRSCIAAWPPTAEQPCLCSVSVICGKHQGDVLKGIQELKAKQAPAAEQVRTVFILKGAYDNEAAEILGVFATEALAEQRLKEIKERQHDESGYDHLYVDDYELTEATRPDEQKTLFVWLLEDDASGPIYWGPHSERQEWTRDPNEAIKFQDQKSAERAALVIGGKWKAVEHGFG